MERHLRLEVAQRSQGAALTEEGVGALGHVSELAPALGRLGVECDSFGVVTGCLGEFGAHSRMRTRCCPDVKMRTVRPVQSPLLRGASIVA